MKKSEIFFSTLLAPLDYLAVFGAFIFSYYLRKKVALDPELIGHWSEIFQIDQLELLPPLGWYIQISLLFGLLIVVIFAFLGLYRIRTSVYSFQELPKVILAVSAGVAAIILISFFLRNFFLPRLIIIFFYFLAIIFISLLRIITRLIQRSLYRFGIGITRISLLGSNEMSKAMEFELKKQELNGLKLVQIYTRSDLDILNQDIKQKKIDQILVTDNHLTASENHLLKELCIDSHVRFTYIPNLFDVSLSRVEIKDIAGFPIIEVKPTSLDGWGRVVKRLFDIVFALVVLIILIPVFIILYILNKIFNPGPFIFKHQRLGLAGQPILVYKIRSLKYEWCDQVKIKGVSGLDRLYQFLEKHPEAKKEWQEKQKLTNDPRINPFGRFLRSSNLDELPQFYNVFRGELSLVGPRPIIENEVSRYGKSKGRLFTIKPGLTGLWQVSGRSELSYDERVKLDVYYVENWSFWWDITILLKTVAILFSRQKGAY